MSRLRFLALMLLSACTSAPLPASNPLRAQNTSTPPVVTPQAPLQLRYHRFVYRLFQAPAAPADIGAVVGQRLLWERPLLDSVGLLAAASNEPALNLLNEEPVLAARGLRIALRNEEQVQMIVGESKQGDAIVRRQANGLLIRRTAGGDETIRMEDPVMRFDAPGSARDLRLEYGDERLRLSGRSGNYELKRNGDAALVQTPRGYLGLTPLPTGVKIESNIKEQQTLQISEAGNILTIDRHGTRDDVTVTQNPDSISFKSINGLDDLTLSRQGNRIEVKYPLNTRSYSIVFSPDKIEIDRWLWGSDTTITRQGNQVKIDRFFYQNDATITRSGNQLNRSHWFSDANAWIRGIQAPDYILEEGGLTLRVTPSGLQPLALALDNGFDVLLSPPQPDIPVRIP